MTRLPDLEKLKNDLNLSDGFSCLDIGANTGQYYLAFKNLFTVSKYLMIEANPHCERRLKKLNVPYKIIGLSDKTGELELIATTRKPYSKGASFYIESNMVKLPDNEILKIKVPVTTMDTLIADDQYDFIKIDVQGAELDVINGGVNTIKKSKYVSLELAFVEYNVGAPQYFQIIKRMEELGFYANSVVEEHRSASNEILQLDLLFTNLISDHRYDLLSSYKDVLKYENWNSNNI